MNKAFEKILKRLDEECISPKDYPGYVIDLEKANEIVQEVAEEYKGDMKYNLAEMYAKNMVDYGVDVTKAWQTATQQSCALEKAYIRGRQYEVDRFNELRKEYNGGWIPCSERLPEPNQKVIVTYMDRYIGGSYGVCEGQYVYILNSWDISDYMSDDDFEVIAWRPLPKPFKEEKNE